MTAGDLIEYATVCENMSCRDLYCSALGHIEIYKIIFMEILIRMMDL